MRLLSFTQALDDAVGCNRRHALLGNGFSIACRPDIFAYGKLYEQADFSQISRTAKLAFTALGSQDFEKVIKALRDAARMVTEYKGDPVLAAGLETDAAGLRELLVQTIAHSHPSWPGEITDEEYTACREFLAHFDSIYTFNYDLLLYWAQMHSSEGEVPRSDDGFRASQDDLSAGYVVWEPEQSHEQNTWFLHGALHVLDAGTEIQKYTWTRTGVRLIDQIRDALARNYFPLFVSEGTSKEKYEKIRHNDYLAKAYRSFSSIQGALFIYGHSLAQNDDHYLRCIQRGKLSHLYIALYEDPDSENNKTIRRRAGQLADGRRGRKPRTVTYFDAASTKVWGR
jgi:Domain of unknown function (DUF4917)